MLLNHPRRGGRALLAFAGAVLIAGLACRDVATGPARGTVAFSMSPVFQVIPGAPLLPINRIRLVATDATSGAVLDALTLTVDPASPEWTIDFPIHLMATDPVSVVVTFELINVTGGVESTQWSGRTAPVSLSVGEAPDAETVQVFRGPPANLGVTNLSVAPSAVTLALGDSLTLVADVTAAPGSNPQLFWTSDNTSVAAVSPSGRVNTLAPGTARIIASAGPAEDTTLVTVIPAGSLMIQAGNATSATVGSVVTPAAAVLVKDLGGLPLPGVRVTFAIATGGGYLVGPTPSTDVNGIATIGSWYLGTTAGANTMTATVGSLAPVTFTATGTAGAAVGLAMVRQPSATVLGGVAFPQQPQVRLRDQYGNAVSQAGVSIAAGVPAGLLTLGGTLTAATDAAGIATFTNLSLGGGAGTVALNFTASGLTATASTNVAVSLPTGNVASVAVVPNRDTIPSLGDTFTLTAQARDAGNNLIVGSFTWVSRIPGIATVNATSGVVTAVANGTTWVVATEAGGLRDSAQITVQQRIASVNVTPDTRNIYLTKTYTFAAAAVDGRGNPVPGSPTFVWSSTAPAVASVNPSTGLTTGLTLGPVQIRATTAGVTGVANVSIVTPITRIDVTSTPVSDTLTLTALGYTRSYSAVARDTLNAVMTGITFAWSSTNGSVAGLDQITATTARATSAANGNTSITASAQGVTGTAALTVQQVLTSIELTPASATIAPTGSMGLVARGVDPNGRYISGGTFSYASDAPPFATVNASTGIVTGVAIGTAHITATSGAITSNQALITVSNTVPARLSFGRDTLARGRSTSASIPILLSTPSASTVTIQLASRDTIAYFNPTSITIPPGQTSGNANLVTRNAGTTEISAVDGGATGYAGDTAVLAVQANVALQSGSYAINTTDQVATQVRLSDPSPAGGTYVTFGLTNQAVGSVSPNPAFIPAGQLAADIIISGLSGGSTSITPAAIGVNGTAANFTSYAPDLRFSATSIIRLGQGQYESGVYVYVPSNNTSAIPVTLTSSDSNVVSVPHTITIPAGSYYAYFTSTTKGVGPVTVTAAAAGWTTVNTLTVVSTTPMVGICCGAVISTTSPQRTLTVYAEDSLRNVHNRTNSLVVNLRSSDTTVIKVLDSLVTIPPGQYYYNTARVIPGGSGGTAYVRATAGGHTSDSTAFTVNGPNLQFSTGSGRLGVGQQESGVYVRTVDNVTAPLTVTFTSTDSTSIAITASAVIPTGSYYAYVDLRAKAPGSVQFTAAASGYGPATMNWVSTSPRVVLSGGGTLNDFGPVQGFNVYSTDSLGNAHNRTASLSVSIMSTDTNVIAVDTAASIAANMYYTQPSPQVRPTGVGTAKLIATAPGHRPDTVTYAVITPKLNFNSTSYRIGVRQHRDTNEFYITTPNNRASNLAVTLTQKHPSIAGLSWTALTIPSGSYYRYFGFSGLTTGTDTIIATAPGYLPDTMFIIVTSLRLTADGIPGAATTTTPAFSRNVYVADSVGNAHYASDTVVVHVVSSDTTVIRPAQPYLRILKNSYFATGMINIVGPGTASLTYSDSAGSGYAPVTTNSITVTGPTLTFSTSNIMLGMRQTDGGSAYIYAPNNVPDSLVVHLASSSTRIATVPDSVIIPKGSYYAYFATTAQDTVGTIQLQATASGYNPATMTVQVTQPRFVISTSTSANTTSAVQGITVYATDANGNAHYTTQEVQITLASSAPGVATIDSTTVTIPAGAQSNGHARWMPGTVGTSQFTATDARAAYYKYTTGTVGVTVNTPSLALNGVPQSLGIGQVADPYVSATDYQPAKLGVTFTHPAGTYTTTVPASGDTIPQGTYYKYFRIIGTSIGTDTLVASATSPAHNPAKVATVVGPGRIDPIDSWPASLHVGDSVQVTLRPRDPQQGNRAVFATTTWTLAPNANIQFVSGGPASAVITSVAVPADALYVQFYVKGVSAGSGSATITAPNYQNYSNTIAVSP